MPLIQESYDSLPCKSSFAGRPYAIHLSLCNVSKCAFHAHANCPTDIDAEPTAIQRTAAQALIDSELSPDVEPNHPLLPAAPEPILTPILESEFARVASKKKLTGIDLSRYEALERPQTSPHSDKNHPETLDLWRNALKASYISHEYLAGRTKHLSELNTSGKEEWLAGNETLVGILKSLEEELATTKEQIDLTVVAREREQKGIEGELRVLEEAWKKGVGRVLETELAAEGLRNQILQARRSGAT